MQFTLRCLVAMSLVLSALVSANPLTLMVPDFKPFTYYEGGQFKGIGVDEVREIMEAVGVPYELVLAPNYKRAVQELKTNGVDGIFLASENDERNQVAEFSEPVMQNRWSWFLLKDTELFPGNFIFQKNAVIASQKGTNTHKWLLSGDYNVGIAPVDVAQLPRMLAAKRVDAVFLAERVFLESCREQGISPDQFVQIVQVDKPFGIYINKQFLKSSPDFMKRLNTSILDRQ